MNHACSFGNMQKTDLLMGRTLLRPPAGEKTAARTGNTKASLTSSIGLGGLNKKRAPWHAPLVPSCGAVWGDPKGMGLLKEGRP